MAGNKRTSRSKREKKQNPFFLVDEILEKRVKYGRPQYLIKWKDLDESQNSWEPEENLFPSLIQAYQERLGKNGTRYKNTEMETLEIGNLSKKFKKNCINEKTSTPCNIQATQTEECVMELDSELEPEEIVGVTDYPGELHYLMKRKGEDLFLMPAKQANQVCPQIVIAYLQENLRWASKTVEEGNNLDEAVLSGDANQKEEDLRRRYAELEPLQILGATKSSGNLYYIMKWKNTDVAEPVLARYMNLIFPQLVIKYLEERILFDSPPRSNFGTQ